MKKLISGNLQIVEKDCQYYIERISHFITQILGQIEDLQSIRVIKQLDQGSASKS